MDRLKHTERWYEIVAGLSDEAYAEFMTTVRELAEADDVISLFECALQYSMATRLEALRNELPDQTVWYNDLKLITKPVEVVLSTLMQMEDDVASTGEGAFAKAVAELNELAPNALSPLSGEACNLSAFDAALIDLQRAAEPVKRKVLAAAVALVVDNDDYTYEQALLIMIIADALRLERPDWLRT